MTPKQRAGRAAIEFVKSGMAVGLGTGSTARCFIDALGEALSSGALRDIRGVPTSSQSTQQAQSLGIPLTDLEETPELDVTIDGADEVAPNLDLIKGLGGALLREKIVAQNSRKLVIIVDESKRVQTLGTHSALPVEVAVFSHVATGRFLSSLGCRATHRVGAGGEPFLTDNGNYIYDCKFESIKDPRALEATLKHRAGVVETGLFLGIASIALLAGESGITRISR